MGNLSTDREALITVSRTAGQATQASVRAQPERTRFYAAFEAMAVFAVCQVFLWNHNRLNHHLWLLILAYLLYSVWRRHETLAHLGLRPLSNLGSLRWMALGVFAGAGPVLVYGVMHGNVVLMLPDSLAILQFLGYAWWCLLQQFALQSFMHNRLLDAIGNKHVTSLMLGVIFGSLHLPNPVLTIATFLGGIAMGEVFARYRNIWVLALAQALVSTAILVSFPDSWHHRLRVGPGFYTWELQR